MPATSSSRRFWQAAAGLAVLLAAGCAAPAAPPQLAALPPIPAGDARLWFYRVFFPEDTRDMPAISLNGSAVGYALAGTSFYRDVPAGQYHVTVDSYGQDYNQSQDVAVASGQNIFIKIASLPSWEASSRGNYRRGTYYARVVPPQLAALEVPQTSSSGGN
jgi:hypothetical protein